MGSVAAACATSTAFEQIAALLVLVGAVRGVEGGRPDAVAEPA